MKTVKIKARYYRDLSFMYKDLGLVKDGNVDPSKVLASKADLKKMRAETVKSIKKEYSYFTKKWVEQSADYHMLNLSPSGQAENGVRPGYLIILD